MATDKAPLFINGQWIPASGEAFSSLNPATGETIWQGKAATSEEVTQAIAAARAALPEWSALPGVERAGRLVEFTKILEAEGERLAQALSEEVGKPYWESLTEIGAMKNKVHLSSFAHASRCSPKISEENGVTSATRFKPHGVAAVLGPFNLPGHLPNAHIVPALVSGNTVVFKASEKTPLCGRILTEFWEAAGLPAGVVNLIQGQLEPGKALVESPDVDAVFFTGGFAGGRAINQACAAHPGKIVALEMGGNNPLIVWEPCEIEPAIYHTLNSAFITSGQRCTCARRLILPTGDFGDRFLEQLIEKTGKLRIGPHDMDPEPFYGPMISAEAAAGLVKAQDELISAGAESLLKLELVKEGPAAAGKALVTPGIIDVTSLNEREDAEFFGPLLQVIRVPDFEAAIAEANATAYGLSAGLLCLDRERYDHYYREARAGIINWNKPITGASGTQPFGGVGNSGNHRPSGYYAVDYCAYPVASTESESLSMPEKLAPGIVW